MYPISVCMIVKNEASNLLQSLPAIRPYVQDIHVVDTGSSDDTKAVAAALGAVVHDFVWVDDFSAARNFSLAKATASYVIVIDADEVFVPETAHALDQYCNQKPRAAGLVRIENLTANEDANITIRMPRLFPNLSQYRYERRVHEQLRFTGQEPQTIETFATFLHTGYTREAMQQKKKIERNLRLLQAERVDSQHDPYLLYQIGKTYYVNQQYKEAATAYQQAVDVLSEIRQVNPSFLPALLAQFAYALLQLKEFTGVFQILSTAIDLYPDFAYLYFLYGQTLIALGDPSRIQEVREAFEYCLKLGESDKYESVRGVGSFMAEYQLGVFYEITGELARAREYYIRSAAHFKPAQDRLKQLM